jgi:sarcosine oxidase
MDVIVAGLGAMGSATASALARRGVPVLGLDRFHPPHDRGSSHGETRVIRAAYFEHPLYVPLVRAAYDRWHELEARSGQRLLDATGVLLVSEPSTELMTGARRSAEEHGVPFESLTHDELVRRYPAIVPAPGAVGLLEPGGGVLYPELCIASFLDDATSARAELHFDEPLIAWRSGRDSVEVETARGSYSCGRLLLAAGAWIPGLLPVLPLQVERQVLHFFDPPDPRPFRAGALPVFLFEEADGPLWYGVPDLGRGLKVGLHHQGAAIVPDTLDRTVSASDIDAVRRLLRQRMPAADVQPTRSIVCMYTNTPDGHFLIDEHPEAPRVTIASPCSGHGFKFASILGELLADRLTGTSGALDLAPFRLDRPALRTAGRALRRHDVSALPADDFGAEDGA